MHSNIVSTLIFAKFIVMLIVVVVIFFLNAASLEMFLISSGIYVPKNLTIPSSLLTLGKILGQG